MGILFLFYFYFSFSLPLFYIGNLSSFFRFDIGSGRRSLRSAHTPSWILIEAVGGSKDGIGSIFALRLSSNRVLFCQHNRRRSRSLVFGLFYFSSPFPQKIE